MAEDARLANVGVAGWNAAAYLKADMATVAIIVEACPAAATDGSGGIGVFIGGGDGVLLDV